MFVPECSALYHELRKPGTSAADLKFLHRVPRVRLRNFKSKSGTRIIESLVPFGFRSSCPSVSNFENRALGADFPHHAVTRRSRRLAVRSKNSAWLATADTVAGWNGLAMRKAGSGRSPVRKRSGYAVMKTTGTSIDPSISY